MTEVIVNPVSPFKAWLITADLPDPNNQDAPSVLGVFTMMQTIAIAGYKSKLEIYQETLVDENGAKPGEVMLDLKLTKPGFPDQLAIIGGYVVFDGRYATVMDATTYQQQYTATT